MLTLTIDTFAIALNQILLGMLAVRVSFVLMCWRYYSNDWLQMVDLRDGGFLAWPGIIALILGTQAYGWRRPALRKQLSAGVITGLVFWGMTVLALNLYDKGTQLPHITLRTAEGQEVQLTDYKGGPLVINLWATWCPPCHREMPVLERAQRQRPDVTFMFVNQAESMQSVSTYLATQGLTLDNVLFDASGRLGQAVGSMALPTTLFYTTDGRLINSHLGELSQASLARAMEPFDTAPERKPICQASATC